MSTNNSLIATFKRYPRWGHVNIDEVKKKPLMALDAKGQEYVADTHGGPLVLFMRCDCGHEFEVPVDAFPGRRALRSCGRPECPHTPKPKPPKVRREPGAAMCLYLWPETVRSINQFREGTEFTFSRAANELLAKGMLAWLSEE